MTEDPERETFAVPAVMRGLVERGALGEKSGAGFYRKEGGEILALDLGAESTARAGRWPPPRCRWRAARPTWRPACAC